MIINNEFFKEELRNKWATEKDKKGLKEFCEENGISTTYFYTHVGKAGEVSQERRYQTAKTKLQQYIMKKVIISPAEIKECEELYLAGKDFREVAAATGINEWEVMGILEDKWQDKQVEKNADDRNNIYGKSIKDLITEGFTDKFIAELFSVAPAKIRGFRERIRLEDFYKQMNI